MSVSRRRARIAAFRSLFAALGQNIAAVTARGQLRNNADNEEAAAFDDELARVLTAYFDEHRPVVEKILADNLSRPLAHISRVERAILCAATAELAACPSTAPGVIIDEAIEIAKQYGAQGGHALVNGVLDAAARWMRQSSDA